MTKQELIRTAIDAAGYRDRQADFCRIACIARRTFARRIRDPDSITVGELRRMDRVAQIDIVKLIRG